jgi:hypothetical protein
LVKDLERRKRVLLLHPQSQRRSFEEVVVKKNLKKIWSESKKSIIFALRKRLKLGLEKEKKEKEIFFSKSLPNQKEVVLLHPL